LGDSSRPGIVGDELSKNNERRHESPRFGDSENVTHPMWTDQRDELGIELLPKRNEFGTLRPALRGNQRIDPSSAFASKCELITR
jgi:hypothetical protein